MPRKCEWLHHIPEALQQLDHFPAPVVDRATLEKLLHIRRREAIRLMHRFGGIRAGKAFVIQRDELRRTLEQVQSGESFDRETRRRTRLSDYLDNQRQQLRGRRIGIAVSPEARYASMGDLSTGVQLQPGQLLIRFHNADELLTRLMELAQAILNDYDRFVALANPSRPNGVL